MLGLIALETRLIFRERLAWLVLAVAALACILAAANGRALLQQQTEGRTAFLADRAKSDADLLKSIRAADPELVSVLPRRATLPIAAPVPPLVDFTAGRARFEDYATAVRLGLREDGLFKRARLDNPELLARGGIDLSFVAVVVLPLLLIALGYGVFAADRDSGVARLALVQQPSAARLMIVRSVPRLLLVLLPLLITASVLLASGPDLPGRAGAAGWWIALAVLLLLFWWALILLVNSFKVSAESAALTLIGAWAVFTLILPAMITAAAQAASPPPSRFEQITAARAAEIRASSEFENDHPELTDEAAERGRQARRAIETDRDVEAALSPLTARFDEQRRGQQDAVRLLSFLSPASIAADGQAKAAGTDGATWLAFRGAAREYLAEAKAALGGILLSGRPLTIEVWRALPRFAWAPPAQRPVVPAAYLLLLTAIIGALALHRFRRAELV